MTLSVCIITFNEEANIGRTLASVQDLVRAVDGEIIVVDSGSTDRTRDIAQSYGAKVFVEDWKGFAAQKNSAIDKASGRWILSVDADEEVSPELLDELIDVLSPREGASFERLLGDAKKIGDRSDRETNRTIRKLTRKLASESLDKRQHVPGKVRGTFVALIGYRIPRRNMFLGRWVRHGGFWPDQKLRLFEREFSRAESEEVVKEPGPRFEQNRLVHEDAKTDMPTGLLRGHIIHHAYPTLSSYIDHMNRYSSLGAQMTGPRDFNLFNIYIRPQLTFFYNYIVRLGFLDGREGLLLHLYHAVYVSWKYAKAWELSRTKKALD